MKRRTFIQLLGAALVATHIPPLVKVGERLYRARDVQIAYTDETGTTIVCKGFTDDGGTIVDLPGFADGNIEVFTNVSDHEVVLHGRRK